MRLPDRVSAPRTRRRDKLSPDPTVRREILAAASTILREHGVQGLSIAAVLERAGLSTRAFYRHFGSKDELVAAVFLETARVEKRRLRRRMASATTEVEAVAVWIDGRLDLAFDDNIRSDLRRLSLEAQSQTLASRVWFNPHTRRCSSRSAKRSSAACSAGCSTASIRSPTRSSSTGWSGRPSTGNGRPPIATATISANAFCVSACAAWARHRKRSPRFPPTTDQRRFRWIWVSPDRQPSSPAAARGWDWPSPKPSRPKGPAWR